MRVSIVSTYPTQRCGIATYTAQLARAITDQGNDSLTVLAERGALDGIDGPVQSVATFQRHDEYERSILERTVKVRADIMHVQHAPDIFGMDTRLLRLLLGLRACGVRSVVRLHTVLTVWRGAMERH